MSTIERVTKLSLPADQFVVIGSGVLDALKLREAGDVDLIVTPVLFQSLKEAGWESKTKYDEEYLEKGDVEVWLSWGSVDRMPNFNELFNDSVTIEGVRFANPRFVINWKKQRASEKDLKDIALLEEYLRG